MMGKSRFSEDGIAGILAEHHSEGISVAELCRKYGMSGATFYRWQSRHGSGTALESTKLKRLEEENQKLKRILAEVLLSSAALCDMLEKPLHEDHDEKDARRTEAIHGAPRPMR
jgi:putative transposase